MHRSRSFTCFTYKALGSHQALLSPCGPAQVFNLGAGQPLLCFVPLLFLMETHDQTPPVKSCYLGSRPIPLRRDRRGLRCIRAVHAGARLAMGR